MSKPQSLESARVMDDVALRREILTPDLRGLIAWLETQEPTTTYQWTGGYEGCVAQQFLIAIGHPVPWSVTSHAAIFGEHWTPGGGGDTIKYHAVTNCAPFTFGGALSRARALTAAAFQEGEGK